MQMYLANTDNSWFDFLKERKPQEINFWKPSQQIFKAIDEGGLFVFRLKSPRGVIGGYGTLATSLNAPIRLAWDSLGEGNGVSNVDTMIEAINRYRKSRETFIDSMIGCRVLIDPVFFDEEDWFPVPRDWSNNIVTGKVYDTTTQEGRELLANLEMRTQARTLFDRDRKSFDGMGEEPAARYGAPVMTRPRLGQGSFRVKVSQLYNFCCALSETKVLPALEAAHIRPYSRGGSHTSDNGVLLRKDIHSVFDAGFATFDDDCNFVVSNKVKEVFNNGNEYRKLHGRKLFMPLSNTDVPALENLRWHQSNCYVGD